MRNLKQTKCELCQRERKLTFHHLIPKKNHNKTWFKRRFSKEEMQTRGIMVCKDCHKKIHQLHNEKVLGIQYNRLELLLQDEAILKFISWVKKKKR